MCFNVSWALLLLLPIMITIMNVEVKSGNLIKKLGKDNPSVLHLISKLCNRDT